MVGSPLGQEEDGNKTEVLRLWGLLQQNKYAQLRLLCEINFYCVSATSIQLHTACFYHKFRMKNAMEILNRICYEMFEKEEKYS